MYVPIYLPLAGPLSPPTKLCTPHCVTVAFLSLVVGGAPDVRSRTVVSTSSPARSHLDLRTANSRGSDFQSFQLPIPTSSLKIR